MLNACPKRIKKICFLASHIRLHHAPGASCGFMFHCMVGSSGFWWCIGTRVSASARSVSEWCGCHNSFGRLNVTGVRLDDCSCRCLSEANLQTLRTKTLLAGALRNRATPLSILETCCVSESGIVSPLHLTRKGSNFPGFSGKFKEFSSDLARRMLG